MKIKSLNCPICQKHIYPTKVQISVYDSTDNKIKSLIISKKLYDNITKINWRNKNVIIIL